MTTSITTARANIWTQVGHLGLDSPKLEGFDGYIVVERAKLHARTPSGPEEIGVRVVAYGADRCQYSGGRRLIRSEIVWGSERFDATAKNRIGLRGAYVDVAPDTSLVQGAVTRARIAIESQFVVVEVAS